MNTINHGEPDRHIILVCCEFMSFADVHTDQYVKYLYYKLLNCCKLYLKLVAVVNTTHMVPLHLKHNKTVQYMV